MITIKNSNSEELTFSESKEIIYSVKGLQEEKRILSERVARIQARIAEIDLKLGEVNAEILKLSTENLEEAKGL